MQVRAWSGLVWSGLVCVILSVDRVRAQSPGGVHPSVANMSPTAPGAAILGHDLRNQVSASLDVTDAQALRLFTDPVANAQRVALFTPGARLIVLEPGQNTTKLETDALTGKILDFGSGGMALAIGAARQVGAEDLVDIYFGPQAFFAALPPSGSSAAADLTSVVAHVEYVGSSSFASSSLRSTQMLRLDGTGVLPKVYGVCGMEVGDIVPGNGLQELVVGSLDGHLLVFGLDATTGAIITPPLYQQQVEGAVGLFNSIVIKDLAAPFGQNELYVAGSLGLRRWVP